MELDRLMIWLEPWIATDFRPSAYDEGSARATLAAAGRSGDDHARFLKRWNGCYAYQGNLHVFGACAEPPNQSLDAWNRADGWRQSFGALVDGIVFFAEAGFGDQFGYLQGKVVRLKALEGRVERIASGFGEWLELVSLEPGRWLAMDLYEACARRHGALPYGGHFVPRQPYVLGAAIEPEAVDVMPSRDSMELKGAASMTGIARGGAKRTSSAPAPRR